ncbi:uncharacterized protein LOC143902216 isoform X2 [Temnothorax americanus]|uniref:uncharacterized protein LOC143902216 isoform X2 n=1 Tax=Temnothorax americanus TaxID=1964332 RepID=UPI004068BD09
MEKTIKNFKKESHWCAVTGCMSTINVEKRHFFLFPKEHDRWLAWVQACRRSDLIPKGPEYAHRNCRLCHVHFEEDKYKMVKSRARLHPDAVPKRCLEFTNNNSTTASAVSTDGIVLMEYENNNVTIMDNDEALNIEQHMLMDTVQEETTNNTCFNVGTFEMDLDVQIATPSTSREENNSNLQLPEPERVMNNDAEIAGPSTSGTCTKTQQANMSSDNSPRKTKLRLKNKKLKAQVKSLRETIRRLRKGKVPNSKKKQQMRRMRISLRLCVH